MTTIVYDKGKLYVCQINYGNAWYYIGPERIVRHSNKSFHYDTVKFSQLPYEVQKEYLLWRMSRSFQ